MKVLQIIPKLQVGGVERGVVDFSKYLLENGHTSIVISSGGRLVEELVSLGAIHYYLPVDKKSLISALYCIKKVKKIILREKVDVVHCRSRVPDWIGYFAAVKTPAEFVITAHGHYSVHFFSKIVAFSKVVIAPSKIIAKHLIDSFKVHHSKIKVIYRGLDISKFGFVSLKDKQDKDIKICFLGRISPIKGVEYFIKAINHIVKDYDNVTAFIAGGADKGHKDYETFLKRLVNKLGLSEKVQFLGHANSAALLKEMHFLVLPSLIPESFGRVIIEAQARGVVCVASNIGGPAEIIEPEKTGFLVPAYDGLAIAEKIKKVIDDKDYYNSIVKTARKRVEQRYTADEMSRKTLDVYCDCKDKKNILVIKISSLGDVVLGTAALKALRKKFPQGYISVLCSRAYFKIIEGSDFIDEIIIYEPDNPYFKEVIRISNIVRRKNIDILIDLQNNKLSHLISWLSLPKRSVGFDKRLGFFLDVKIDYKQARLLNPLQSQKLILERLGIEKMEYPELKINRAAKREVDVLLKENGLNNDDKLVGLNLQASFKWKTKNLKKERLESLIRYLVEDKGVKVVLVGQDQAFAKAESIRNLLGSHLINMCGKTDLLGLVALISRTNLFITPDSAPFHISLSLDIPTIGIFGPTSPEKHAVVKKNAFVVIKKELGCLGCYKKNCSHSWCMNIGTERFKKIIEEILR